MNVEHHGWTYKTCHGSIWCDKKGHETSQTCQSTVRSHQLGTGMVDLIPDHMLLNSVVRNAVQWPLYKIYIRIPSPMPAENVVGSLDPQLDWDAMGDNFEGQHARSHMQASVAEMIMILKDWLSNGELGGM